jgi:putative acetyltransferase
VDIRREKYEAFASRALIAALNAELLERYDGVDGSGGERVAADFEPPEGAFVVGWEGEEPVACGGITRYDETTAEIVRMYVAPAARGRGLSRLVLAALEDEARRLRFDLVRLETGDRQPEAIRLYASSGFEPIPRYGPFVDDPRSVCFEKRL